jgi:hypothetical protein
MPKLKCIEVSCNNQGTKAVLTYDNQKIYVCENHLQFWLENGAVPKQALFKVALGIIKHYGYSSAVFLMGFSLVFYDVYMNHQTTITSIPSLTGLTLLVLSWIIFCLTLRAAYSRAREQKAMKTLV